MSTPECIRESEWRILWDSGFGKRGSNFLELFPIKLRIFWAQRLAGGTSPDGPAALPGTRLAQSGRPTGRPRTPLHRSVSEICEAILERLASAQMSAVLIDPFCFPDLHWRQGLRYRQFRNQLSQSGDELPWLGLGRQVGNESIELAAAPREASHRRPSGNWSSLSILSMNRTN